MEISSLTLKLIILLTPGAISATIYKRLSVRHKETSDFIFVIRSIMMGLICYLILQTAVFCIDTVVYVYNHGFHFCNYRNSLSTIDTFKKISDSDSIPYRDVIFASLISFLLGLTLTKFDNNKLIHRIARKYKVSNKYGDENLFSYYLSSDKLNWVYIRDIANSLSYLGCVKIFSEDKDFKEIVLEQVIVYNYPDSEELYEIDSIYLCLPKDKIIIEQAKINNNGKEQQQDSSTANGNPTDSNAKK